MGDIRSIRRGDILPSKSVQPVVTVVMRDYDRSVTVVHSGGYVWHGIYGEAVEIAPR